MNEAATRIEVSLSRGEFSLDVSLAWDARVAVIFGPSGSGKSTLLEAVLGLLPADAARIRVEALCSRIASAACVAVRAARLGAAGRLSAPLSASRRTWRRGGQARAGRGGVCASARHPGAGRVCSNGARTSSRVASASGSR